MHRTPPERRARRLLGCRRQRPPDAVDSLVVSPSLEEVLAAMEAVNPQLPWADVEGSLLPVFPRRRPMPSAADPSVCIQVPPGVPVGIGVDIGPAFMHVSGPILESWGMSAETALARAVENVRERATTRHLEPIHDGNTAGVPTRFFQTGESIGSALLLLPDEVLKRFGREPQFILAPMRDLLVSVPEAAGLRFAAELMESIAEEDPNCLDLPVFRLAHGQLTIAGPGQTRAGARVH